MVDMTGQCTLVPPALALSFTALRLPAGLSPDLIHAFRSRLVQDRLFFQLIRPLSLQSLTMPLRCVYFEDLCDILGCFRSIRHLRLEMWLGERPRDCIGLRPDALESLSAAIAWLDSLQSLMLPLHRPNLADALFRRATGTSELQQLRAYEGPVSMETLRLLGTHFALTSARVALHLEPTDPTGLFACDVTVLRLPGFRNLQELRVAEYPQSGARQGSSQLCLHSLLPVLSESCTHLRELACCSGDCLGCQDYSPASGTVLTHLVCLLVSDFIPWHFQRRGRSSEQWVVSFAPNIAHLTLSCRASRWVEFGCFGGRDGWDSAPPRWLWTEGDIKPERVRIFVEIRVAIAEAAECSFFD